MDWIMWALKDKETNTFMFEKATDEIPLMYLTRRQARENLWSGERVAKVKIVETE